MSKKLGLPPPPSSTRKSYSTLTARRVPNLIPAASIPRRLPNSNACHRFKCQVGTRRMFESPAHRPRPSSTRKSHSTLMARRVPNLRPAAPIPRRLHKPPSKRLPPLQMSSRYSSCVQKLGLPPPPSSTRESYPTLLTRRLPNLIPAAPIPRRLHKSAFKHLPQSQTSSRYPSYVQKLGSALPPASRIRRYRQGASITTQGIRFKHRRPSLTPYSQAHLSSIPTYIQSILKVGHFSSSI